MAAAALRPPRASLGVAADSASAPVKAAAAAILNNVFMVGASTGPESGRSHDQRGDRRTSSAGRRDFHPIHGAGPMPVTGVTDCGSAETALAARRRWPYRTGFNDHCAEISFRPQPSAFVGD